MKDRMRATVDRMEQLVSPVVAAQRGVIAALLDTRDLARDEQAWIRSGRDGSQLALQYRVLMASIEIHASEVLAHWPDDPENDPSAHKLGQVQALLFKDFRDILDEGEPSRTGRH